MHLHCECAGHVPSSSIHNMYIKACKMCLSFPCVCLLPILVCVCVCFVFVCVTCVAKSCSVECLCVIDLVSNPGHLAAGLALPDHHHCCQNFLYFQNRLFRLLQRWWGGVGGLREPCVAFYEPSQLHALVAATRK